MVESASPTVVLGGFSPQSPLLDGYVPAKISGTLFIVHYTLLIVGESRLWGLVGGGAPHSLPSA
jgi:hypothetical protein